MMRPGTAPAIPAHGHVLVRLLLLLLVLFFVLSRCSAQRTVAQGPGVLAPEVPLQSSAGAAAAFEHEGYRITPLHRFELKARVLSREDYHLGEESKLSPTDLALGWGRMSDGAVLEKIDISQSGRWYRWYTSEPPIPLDEIAVSSANMHLIPANDEVARALAQVRKGHVVSVQGLLVRVVHPTSGWTWTSSETRTDTGGGSCELIWVERLAIQP